LFACGDDINLELVYPPINPEYYDNSKPLKDRDIDFLFVGRIAPDKLRTFDFETFDDHVKEGGLWDLRGERRYKSLFVGSGWATGYNPNTTIEFKRNANFNEVRDAQQNAKIYIHTKPTEDFGQVITEALSTGCVVMVPDPSFSAAEFANVVYYRDTPDLLLKIRKVLNRLDKYDQEKVYRRAEAQNIYNWSVGMLKVLFPV
jgi:glycosyltransferase involved in cell wall biosynthesis